MDAMQNRGNPHPSQIIQQYAFQTNKNNNGSTFASSAGANTATPGGGKGGVNTGGPPTVPWSPTQPWSSSTVPGSSTAGRQGKGSPQQNYSTNKMNKNTPQANRHGVGGVGTKAGGGASFGGGGLVIISRTGGETNTTYNSQGQL